MQGEIQIQPQPQQQPQQQVIYVVAQPQQQQQQTTTGTATQTTTVQPQQQIFVVQPQQQQQPNNANNALYDGTNDGRNDGGFPGYLSFQIIFAFLFMIVAIVHMIVAIIAVTTDEFYIYTYDPLGSSLKYKRLCRWNEMEINPLTGDTSILEYDDWCDKSTTSNKDDWCDLKDAGNEWIGFLISAIVLLFCSIIFLIFFVLRCSNKLCGELIRLNLIIGTFCFWLISAILLIEGSKAFDDVQEPLCKPTSITGAGTHTYKEKDSPTIAVNNGYGLCGSCGLLAIYYTIFMIKYCEKKNLFKNCN